MSVFKIRKRVKKLIPATKSFLANSNRAFRSRKSEAKPGMSPGTLSVPEGAMPTQGTITRYSVSAIDIQEFTPSTDLNSLLPRTDDERVWLSVTGLLNIEWIRRIGEFLHMNPLSLEDVFETNTRAKLEHHEERIFLVARMVDGHRKLPNEKISFFLSDRILLTIDERDGDIFEPVRERLRGGRGKIRVSSCDYLLYTLLDTIVDHYLLLVEQFDEEADRLEESIITMPTQENFRELHALKMSVRDLQRQFRPHRVVVEELISKAEEEEEGSLIRPATKVFFKDCLDHVVISLDHFDRLHDELSSLMDLYQSMVSNRQSETMKVLTLFSAFFMPLTFIVGIYGMNFNPDASPYNMPELNSYYGYPGALLAMVLTCVLLYAFFRRNRLI